MNIPVLRKLFGSSVIAWNLRYQKQVPFMDREKLERLRDRNIRQTVLYAYSKVPYYREWFRNEGIDPGDIKGAEELDRLPVLDKELVRARPDLFMAEGSKSSGAISFRTSGTTGVPIEIYHDRRSMLANIAYGERERDPSNEICGGSFRPKELYVGYETSTFKKVTGFYADNVLLPVKPLRRQVSLIEPIEKIAAILNEEKPDILVGYGGWINLFFRTVEAKGISIKRPKMVMYIGEALPHGTREYIEGELGIPVLTRYNAVESFKIGFYCQARRGFHVHEDLCHLRIVDGDGKNVPTGKTGEVVISNLVNRASVLLNYPMGDMAEISREECPCGRSFKLLSELEGRTEDILALADGSFIHPRSIWQIFKEYNEVLQYQMIQKSPRVFEVNIVTPDEPSFLALKIKIDENLRGLLGNDAEIEIKWFSEIIQRPGRKFRVVVSCQITDDG